jgi:hypothetical protein
MIRMEWIGSVVIVKIDDNCGGEMWSLDELIYSGLR